MTCTFQPSRGRHSVAAREIAVGEVIMADRPAVESILMSLRATHCAECAQETVAPVPCRKCASVVFCSEECRLERGLNPWSLIRSRQSIPQHLRSHCRISWFGKLRFYQNIYWYFLSGPPPHYTTATGMTAPCVLPNSSPETGFKGPTS